MNGHTGSSHVSRIYTTRRSVRTLSAASECPPPSRVRLARHRRGRHRIHARLVLLWKTYGPTPQWGQGFMQAGIWVKTRPQFLLQSELSRFVLDISPTDLL
ncbi:hypothetical protein DPEC_G00162740 [Dallia pectoralis]|uniref:Uncharacterized protein n=1 Tax=Dallia pectoralis TaxID=75939 RepID=A0ACC2GH63_DALPE|nr:hypothetical protein DPEC_G00162740 [Dallia pectoralis]